MYASFTYPYMCCLFTLFMHMLLNICTQSTISISDKDALMIFFLSVSEIQVVKVYLHKLSSFKVFQEFVLG